MYQITMDELQSVLSFINDPKKGQLDITAARKIVGVADALNKTLLNENLALRNKANSLAKSVDRLKSKINADKALVRDSDSFDCTGLSSIDVANAFLYCLQQNKVVLTKEKFRYLLYLAYCSWLHNSDKRLFIEEPYAIKTGPIFWVFSKEYKDKSVINAVPYEYWTTLTTKSSAVAGFLKSFSSSKLCKEETEHTLSRMLEKSYPFVEAMKAAEKVGKKSHIISDKDIWYWKDEQKK